MAKFKAVEFDQNIRETGNVTFHEGKNVYEVTEKLASELAATHDKVQISPNKCIVYLNDTHRNWAVVPYKGFQTTV